MRHRLNDVPRCIEKVSVRAGETQSLFETRDMGSPAPMVSGTGTAQAAAGEKDSSRARLNAADPGGPVLLLSILQAARTLGLGRSKMYELIAAGDLEVVHIGRATRVPVDAVERFVERLRTQ
jgi:excisionase family DNA binding protein